jgi:hypothetical protein
MVRIRTLDSSALGECFDASRLAAMERGSSVGASSYFLMASVANALVPYKSQAQQ